MAGKKQLPPVRIATEDDLPSEPLTLLGAIGAQDRLAEIVAKRRIIAAHIDHPETLARDLASLLLKDEALADRMYELLSRDEPDELGKAADTGDENFNPRAV